MIEHDELHRVQAGADEPFPRDVRGAVERGVVNHQIAVNPQRRAVITDVVENVTAGRQLNHARGPVGKFLDAPDGERIDEVIVGAIAFIPIIVAVEDVRRRRQRRDRLGGSDLPGLPLAGQPEIRGERATRPQMAGDINPARVIDDDGTGRVETVETERGQILRVARKVRRQLEHNAGGTAAPRRGHSENRCGRTERAAQIDRVVEVIHVAQVQRRRPRDRRFHQAARLVQPQDFVPADHVKIASM